MGYLDDKGLRHLWPKVKSALAAKQDALTGLPGQVVGFDDSGGPVPVRGWSNQNLIINWDFRNPVNRNGKMEYTATEETIDGWSMSTPSTTGSVSLVDSGVKLFAANPTGKVYFSWKVRNAEQYLGETLTFSLLCSAGMFVDSFDVPSDMPTSNTMICDFDLGVLLLELWLLPGSGKLLIQLNTQNTTEVILNATKLEFGPYQTLAYQDEDGNWIINDPPDYDLQYALCSLYSPITGEWVGYQHSNENLLDNAYWASKDAIINQWGQEEYTAAGYAIDRWRMLRTNMTVTIESDGIVLDNTLGTGPAYWGEPLEDISFLDGQTVALSFLTDNDLYTAVGVLNTGITDWQIAPGLAGEYRLFVAPTGASTGQTNPIVCFQIYAGAKVKVKAVKFELGSVQTLAHQDANGNWVLNDPPPNRALELAKCQRYQMALNAGITSYARFGLGLAAAGTYAMIQCPIPAVMRANPSVIKTGAMYLYGGVGSLIPVTSLRVDEISSNVVNLRADVASGLTVGSTYELRTSEDITAQIMLDANL